jgi:hypothetical protein
MQWLALAEFYYQKKNDFFLIFAGSTSDPAMVAD